MEWISVPGFVQMGGCGPAPALLYCKGTRPPEGTSQTARYRARTVEIAGQYLNILMIVYQIIGGLFAAGTKCWIFALKCRRAAFQRRLFVI